VVLPPTEPSVVLPPAEPSLESPPAEPSVELPPADAPPVVAPPAAPPAEAAPPADAALLAPTSPAAPPAEAALLAPTLLPAAAGSEAAAPLPLGPPAALPTPTPLQLEDDLNSLFGSEASTEASESIALQRKKTQVDDMNTLYCELCCMLQPYTSLRCTNKRDLKWRCKVCLSKFSQMSREFGSWPTRSFAQLDEEAKAKFYQEIKKLPFSEIRVHYSKHIETYAAKEWSYVQNGEFLPLSVWAMRGFDVAVIAARTPDCDKHEHPILGLTFRIRLISTSVKTSEGTVTRESLRHGGTGVVSSDASSGNALPSGAASSKALPQSSQQAGVQLLPTKQPTQETRGRKRDREERSANSSSSSSSSTSAANPLSKKAKKKAKKAEKKEKNKALVAEKQRKEAEKLEAKQAKDAEKKVAQEAAKETKEAEKRAAKEAKDAQKLETGKVELAKKMLPQITKAMNSLRLAMASEHFQHTPDLIKLSCTDKVARLQELETHVLMIQAGNRDVDIPDSKSLQKEIAAVKNDECALKSMYKTLGRISS